MGHCCPGRGDGAQAGLVTLEMQRDGGPKEYWEVGEGGPNSADGFYT